MASITSLTNSGSSTSGLYGNRNVISGLASGMDTESMIENSVSGYKSKITSLQQKMTKLQWKQDAYRGLINQMNNILNKYTSYTSSTNLFGAAFFRSAVNTVASGANAAMVSATGKSSSDVAINAVKQLAESASYTVDTKGLVSNGVDTSEIKWDEDVKTSAVSGSLSIKYGGGAGGKGSSFTLRFAEDEVFEDAQQMADAINEKLKSKNITTSDGAKSADQYIEAQVVDGKVVLADKKGNSFEVSGVSGDMAKVFEKGKATGGKISTKDDFDGTLFNTTNTADYLKEKSIKVTLDGKTKTIDLSFIDEKSINNTTDFAAALQEKLDAEFGKDKVKVSAGADGNLEFGGVAKGSTLKVAGSSTVNKALGLGEDGYSNTLQTSWSLEKALGNSFTWTDETDDKGNAIKTAEITINGETIKFNSTDTIQSVMDKINGNDKAGVNIKFSSMTGNFAISTKDTGADTKIDISGELGAKLFGMDTANNIQNGNMKAGQDAIFNVTINGEEMQLKRASNTVDLDGLKVTLKGTFGEYSETADANGEFKLQDKPEAITFSTTSDSDKIVDAVKAFVADYNALITDLHKAYSTMPLQDSKGNSYDPLTEEEAAKNTESYNKSYEEKAKTGILFGDSDLSNLYTKLTQAVQGSGGVGQALRSIGLDVNYTNGLSTITLDEEKLRSALDSDPDKVKDAFTQSTSSGASVNGLMANIKTTMEQYASTSIARPGILVNKAGSTLSSYSLSHNELNDQINTMQEEIDKWQDRMSDKIDFYTNQFTQLEMLINQMNSQSSMLMGLTGG